MMEDESDTPWSAAWGNLWEEVAQRRDRFDIRSLGKRRYQITYRDRELFFSPFLELTLPKKLESSKQDFLRRSLAASFLATHEAALRADLATAAAFRGALSSTVWSHQNVLLKTDQPKSSDEPFIHIDFPSLTNVSLESLIELRLAEKDSFLSFRTALRTAMRTIAAESHNQDPRSLASEIMSDVVNPEIAKLQSRLEAARRVLAAKSAISLAVAGVSTLCGVQLGVGVPVAVGAGALGAFFAGLNTAAAKYAEEKREIELSDMFFIWKATRCTK